MLQASEKLRVLANQTPPSARHDLTTSKKGAKGLAVFVLFVSEDRHTKRQDNKFSPRLTTKLILDRKGLPSSLGKTTTQQLS